MQSNETRLVLDKWVIHSDMSSIQRGDEVVHLEPKVMEVLVYLMNNANRVISREELTQNVWQSKYTSDEVITRAISVLRKKLGDTGKVHKYIKTIPKHGYILELPDDVTNTSEESAQNKNTTRRGILRKFIWVLSAMVLVMVIIIAILSHKLINVQSNAHQRYQFKVDQFRSIDNRPDTAMVAQVLSERLITTLSNSEAANVVVEHDLLLNEETQSIDFIFRGGVQWLADEYKVTVQFIDGKSGDILWTQGFAGASQEWNELVNNIAQTIEYFVTVAAQDELDLRDLSLKRLQAAIIVHQARELRQINTPENAQLVINLLENAHFSYPDEASIAAELLWSYLQFVGDRQPHLDKQRIEQLFNKLEADALNEPMYIAAQALYAYQVNTLTLEQAISALQQAIRNHTDSSELKTHLARLYRVNGRYELAMQQLTEVMINKPDYSLAKVQWAKIQSQQGNHQLAIDALQEFIKRHPDDFSINHLLVDLYMGTGQFTVALQHLAKLDGSHWHREFQHRMADSYYFLNQPQYTIDYYQNLDVGDSAVMVAQRNCLLSILQQHWQQALSICKQVATDNNPRGRFHYARVLMLTGNFVQSVNEYRAAFKLVSEQQYRYSRDLLLEQIDYVFTLAQAGLNDEAVQVATPILDDIGSKNRLGYLGYGIADVILLYALQQPKNAEQAFDEALSQGWLHWYNWRYGGPHPVLSQLTTDVRYLLWQQQVDEALLQQLKILK
ncbi:winged helix-turn-helix domain-containing protein [Thalassotalea maritima]|uniref:winged helix-turn-helix domain-containing protein n=1 Tax=Thalassotalea maritima TaxID=3242416 RepID=UPI003527ED3C